MLKTSKPDFEKVVFYCQEVISITPNNPKAHYRMAQALYFLKDFEGALQACEHSLLCQDTHGNFPYHFNAKNFSNLCSYCRSKNTET